MRTIRGTLPSQQRILSAMRPVDGCGSVTGDGDGVFEPVNTLVFVFEGLPTDGNYPRGIQSFRITSADKPELLKEAGELSETDLRK